jgi:RNA polymerase sigma factor (sigma-70 family)
LAEEVAQSTFINLARHADRLGPDTILTAWLYQVTRREAIDVVRREARRQSREQIATEMNAMNATAGDWTHVEPLLDEAMHVLDETDRAAVLLRYFENKSLREVGATLGTSDDAAQKRVSRAVERMREFFIKRGITIGASAVGVVISANAVQVAPVGLGGTITAAAVAGATVATAKIATITKTVAMNTLQKSLVLSAIVVVGGSILLVTENRSLRKPGKGRETIESAARTLATNEMLYREMTSAYPIAGEVVAGDPTRMLWEDRKSTLLQVGYIESRQIPLSKPLSAKGAARTFFDHFQARFYGVEIAMVNRGTPPIATVTARKTDFGPTGVIEQFIHDYDPEKE